MCRPDVDFQREDMAHAIDTLRITQKLESAGVDRRHAEAHAEALNEVVVTEFSELATKADLERLPTREDLRHQGRPQALRHQGRPQALRHQGRSTSPPRRTSSSIPPDRSSKRPSPVSKTECSGCGPPQRCPWPPSSSACRSWPVDQQSAGVARRPRCFRAVHARWTARADTSRKRHPRSTTATVAPAATAIIRPGAPIARGTASQ